MEPINATVNSTSSVEEAASMSMLKKTLDDQQNAVQQLLKSLPTVQDPALGKNVDLLA
jgi:hypothetical protein